MAEEKGRRYLIFTDLGTYIKLYEEKEKELGRKPTPQELSDMMLKASQEKEDVEVIGSVGDGINGSDITDGLRKKGLDVLDINEEDRKEDIRKRLKNKKQNHEGN